MSRKPVKTEESRLKDLDAERNVLSAMLEHGSEVFFDIDGLLNEEYFFYFENKIIYSAYKHIITTEGVSKPDGTSVASYIKREFGDSVLSKYAIPEVLKLLTQVNISKENVAPFTKRVARLGLTRKLDTKLSEAKSRLNGITGNESMQEIVSIAEQPFSDFTISLIGSNDIVEFSSIIDKFAAFLKEERPDARGIPSSFPLLDKALGGGLRAPGFHLIGARAKVGKTSLAINMASQISKTGLPVLYLDTEMTQDMMMTKLLGLNAKVAVATVETGKFSQSLEDATKIASAVDIIKKLPISYYNISGLSHYEWISVIRRWFMRKVGFDRQGRLNPCLVVLDYLKMMDASKLGDLKEYQYLGQIATDLHNLCIKYNFPILSMIQLNRDGIDKEDDSVIADSDKILRLCSSFTILKNKSEADFAADPPYNGTKKLITVASRFGGGTGFGTYINVKCDLDKCIMVEGKYNTDNQSKSGITLEQEENESNDLVI